jgi:hypothetical protein
MQHDDNTTKEARECYDRKNTTSAQEFSQLGIPPNGAITIASEAELGALGPRVSITSTTGKHQCNACHIESWGISARNARNITGK